MVTIGQKTLKDKLDIDVIAQLKESVPKACGHRNAGVNEMTSDENRGE